LFRIQKLEKDEHFSDCKPVGDGIRELRINFAKGYRLKHYRHFFIGKFWCLKEK
jgi:putative component of toxin-antitoxin plasmid stabilization module